MKMRGTLESTVLLATLFVGVAADGTYKSRPDLSPPHLNITIYEPDKLEKGFLFVAPFNGHADFADHGPLQEGPYILTDTGDLVWSGFTYFSTWTGNFQAGRWQGQDVLFAFEGSHNGLHGHGHGHHTILDNHYRTIKELRAGDHMLSDKHEFIIHDEKTSLIQIHHPLPTDLTAYGGDSTQRWIVDSRFQELDIATGAVLFSWRSLDHIPPSESALPLPLGQAGTGHNSSWAWDYFHINSLEKGGDGHYLLSARHASTVYKINGTSGAVIWRLGGRRSDFALGPGVAFGFQHHARWLSEGAGGCDHLSLFDNSVHGAETAGGGENEVVLHPYSRGKHLRVCVGNASAELLQAFRPPGDLLVKSQGSLQALPRGNVLANWGSEGAVTEFAPDGAAVWHAELDSGDLQDGVQNYRAFRFNWTGWAGESPAVVTEADGEGVETVYVSWNGDTQTRVWQFYESDGHGWKTFVGEAKRTGFETAFALGRRVNAAKIVVEALDRKGNVLATAKADRPEVRVTEGKKLVEMSQVYLRT
ncbi:hypothetical protein MMC22_008311 [Neofusicoccum parvum]|uniref:Uncharacterized protein n=1 Tax=Neofusicoccum parvum TaxID=310453 RepID=A0ACB5SPK4_9PEZI|nr:hypothetical protein MMC22_008311 [Neofusicoccum parvum]